MEDFNGEKSDRFMCETISESEIFGMLDAARLWLLSKQGMYDSVVSRYSNPLPASSISMRAELIARIELRRVCSTFISFILPASNLSQAILTILSPLVGVPNLQATLRLAQSHLKDIQTFKTPPEPTETSPAYHAFDPAISRRLLSIMPLKITPLPEQATVWNDYFLLLSGFQEVCILTKCPLILQIKVRDSPTLNVYALTLGCTGVTRVTSVSTTTSEPNRTRTEFCKCTYLFSPTLLMLTLITWNRQHY